MHFPFTPNHVQLIAACYPPGAALITSGPEYRPNSQELSRMTYYASNKPGKINKLGGELERRVRADAKKAQAGNMRSRASLLITLAMFKALATECRRDIALLSSSLLASVDVTMTSLSSDLEVGARAATVFTAWAAYTDGHLIGVDKYVTEEYMSCLNIFSRMGKADTPSMDNEVRNRTRLLGLAALFGLVTSEALYYSSSQFKPQVLVVIPALMIPLFATEVSTLEQEASDLKEQPRTPFLDNLRERPKMERRATSIHLHIDGDKGPSSADVAHTALRALSTLAAHANANQASIIMRSTFDCFDDTGGWGKVEHCKWIAMKTAEWTQYQYRYAIPSRLVETLAESQNDPHTTPRHLALAAMIKTVFTSPTPLISLSTSDIISSLINVILRRVNIDANDPLLPSLVECIAALGTHIYYADQIQDLAAELVSRLVILETNGLGGAKSGPNARSQATRCLLAGLIGIIHTANTHEIAREDGADDSKPRRATSPTSTTLNSPLSDTHTKQSRRTKVTPDIWQDTLTLLCDSEYCVRADYTTALVSYLHGEIPRLVDFGDSEGSRRARTLLEGPVRQASIMTSVMYGDSTTRFLHALHAHTYVLATSSVLDTSYSSASSPQRSENGDSESEGRSNSSAPVSRDATRRSTTLVPRSRKTSVTLRMLRGVPRNLSTAPVASASLSDYANLGTILSVVQENLPIRGLLTGVPMLLALAGACQCDSTLDSAHLERLRVVRGILARVWSSIGKIWDSPEIIALSEKLAAASSLPLDHISAPTGRKLGVLHPPQDPIPFETSKNSEESLPGIDCEALLLAVCSCRNVQETTGLDRQALLKRLTAQWTPERAFNDSIEIPTSYDVLRGGDTISPLIKVAPALMQIENNMSLQSLARSTRGVGVTDLREALEGRNSLSNPNLNKAPSLSTLEHTSSMAHGEPMFTKLAPVRSRPQQRSKLGGSGDVRDVLNKLGIGKQSGNNLLKSSFPMLQKTESRTTIPPYKG